MNVDPQKTRFPVKLIVLDAIGTLLFVIGALAHFWDIELIPAGALGENYGPTLMLIGIVLVVPMLRYIFRLAKESSRSSG